MEVLSVVTNIVSLVQVTCHIINRINDFNSKAGGLPRTLQTFAIELPTLKLTLERLDQAVKNGLIPDDSIQALCPILENCGKEILALKNIIDKVVVKGDSSVIFKAVASFRYDDEVEERKKAIKDYLGTLMLERFISNSSNGIVCMFFFSLTSLLKIDTDVSVQYRRLLLYLKVSDCSVKIHTS